MRLINALMTMYSTYLKISRLNHGLLIAQRVDWNIRYKRPRFHLSPIIGRTQKGLLFPVETSETIKEREIPRVVSKDSRCDWLLFKMILQCRILFVMYKCISSAIQNCRPGLIQKIGPTGY